MLSKLQSTIYQNLYSIIIIENSLYLPRVLVLDVNQPAFGVAQLLRHSDWTYLFGLFRLPYFGTDYYPAEAFFQAPPPLLRSNSKPAKLCSEVYREFGLTKRFSSPTAIWLQLASCSNTYFKRFR
jgi:hypothetical protein